jgi:HK97 family phage prohead protease
MTQQNKNFPVEMKAMEGSRGFKATITTDAMDRDCEVVLPTGMDKRDFMKNPILLWMHDATQPIGKVNSLYRTANGWDMDAEFATPPDGFKGEWKADECYALAKAGILKGISIGFMPLESRAPSKKDIETHGSELRRVITKYKLAEVSLVSVPANQDALITACMKSADLIPLIKKTFNIDIAVQPATPTVVVPPPAPIPVVTTATPPVQKRIIVSHVVYQTTETVKDITAKAIAQATGKLYY